jgi:hypothetical protein
MENKQSTKGYIIIFSLVGILFSGIIVNESDVRPHYLNNHLDVDTTGESSGDVLKFNGTKWIPDNDLTGGGGSGGNIFNQDLNTTNNVTFNNLTLTMYPFLDKNYSDDFDGTWGSLTGKPTKAHPHNQDLNTSSSPTFNVINGNGSGLTIDWNDIYYKPNWLTSFAHPHNQNLNTTNAVTFTTINTGEGANELYDMNQNVQTTDSPTFDNLYLTSLEKARAYVDSSQSYTNWGTWVGVNFSRVNYDIITDFDTANYRYVVPLTGYYQISYSVTASLFADRRYMDSGIFSSSGGAYTRIGGACLSYISYGISYIFRNSASDILYLTSGNWIKVFVYVNGGSGTWGIASGSSISYIAICRIP